MATKTFKIGLSNTDKQNMAQEVYERLLALTFPEYDTATSYDVGDFVVYNDQLYKCIGATTGAWDSTKWQLATLNDLVGDIESAVAFVNDKANVDGNYPTMTVGAADNLTPYSEDSGDDQNEPFIVQGTGCGNGTEQVDTGSLALLKEKRGNTVVVNQLVDPTKLPSTQTVNGITLTNNSDGTLTFSGIATDNANFYSSAQQQFENKSSHRFLVIGATNKVRIYDGYYGNNNEDYYILIPNSSAAFVYYQVPNGTDLSTPQTIRPLLIDLTQWFNGDIPQDLLDHPENFFRYYQGDLSYNPGELVNANGRYVKCIGRNQFNKDTVVSGKYFATTGEELTNADYSHSDYIRVNPNATYYIKNIGAIAYVEGLLGYDKDKNFVSSVPLTNESSYHCCTIPANVCYIIVNMLATEIDTQCVSIYYEDESGYDQYYPYEVLTNNDTGTEVLRSAGSVCDVKKPDGTITRRVGYVDLGSLIWTDLVGGYDHYFNGTTVSGIKPNTTNILSPNLTVNNGAYASMGNLQVRVESDGVSITIRNDSYSTASDFKTAMSGVYLFYELAEPTTEQGTPFSENVNIDDFGAMEISATSFNGVPMGNLIFYPVDYKAFVDTLYNQVGGDGNNVACIKNEGESLADGEPTSIAGVVGKINALLPTLPTTAGKYRLAVTIADGQDPVYEWEAEE